MKTKVKMEIELDIEHDDEKTLEEVQGFAYWVLEPFLEDTTTTTYNIDGCQITKFNMEIK